MAKFNRVDYQQVYSFDAYDADAVSSTYKVGSVISRNKSTGEIAPIASAADAITALGNGLELYIIAQSDAVTYKTGTPYKSYALDDSVVVSTVSTSPSVIAGYRVDNIDNIEW